MNSTAIRFMLLTIVMAIGTVITPRSAQAQCTNGTGINCPDSTPPIIQIFTNGAIQHGVDSVPPRTTVNITVAICADRPLAGSPWTVTYDGANIMSSFTVQSSWPPSFSWACSPLGGTVYAVASILITPGGHTLTVTGTTVNNITRSASVGFFQPLWGVTAQAKATNVTTEINTSTVGIFTVQNVGGDSANYTVTATCSGAAIAANPACSVSPSTLALGSGVTKSVQVSYTTTTTPVVTGTIAIAVTQVPNNASATASMTVRTVTLQTPPINAGAAELRDRCFRAYAARNAEYECGSLRYSYAFPTIHRVGKSITPRLIYSSAMASPLPLISDDVVLPAHGDSVAYTVQAHVYLDGTGADLCNAQWPGSAFPVGQRRRIVCGIQGAAAHWGLHTYLLFVQATLMKQGQLRPDGTLDIATIDSTFGSVMIQNGTTDTFGAGWALEGLETFATFGAGQPAIWSSSDGSMLEYLPNGTNTVFHPVQSDHADSITVASGVYTHWEPHGAQVQTASPGLETQEIDPLGYATRMTFGGPFGALSQIQLPQMTGTGATPITVTYGPQDTTQIGDPTITFPTGKPGVSEAYHLHLVNQQLAWIASPDGDTVKFGVTGGLLTSVTDKNGNVTTFTYDAANTLTSSSISMGGQSPIVRHFRAAESVGLGLPQGTPDSAYVPPDSATTVITGPRVGQVTTVWVDQYGQATGIEDALGQITAIAHGDSRWPGLTTQVVSPNGQILSAVYDGHGNLQSETDANPYGTGDATTTYAYDPKWDLVTKITSPTGVITSMAYDQTDGNRMWQQPGGDTTDHSHRTIYVYDATSKLMTLLYPPTMPHLQFTYDTLGNVNKTVTGLGHKTWFNNDGLGRDTLTAQALDSLNSNYLQTEHVFDALGRETQTVTWGPALTNQEPYREVTTTSAEMVTVQTYYNREDVVDSVKRFMTPDPNAIGASVTGYRYDPAYRVTQEIDPLGQIDSYQYDASGNRTQWTTRRGTVVASTYDLLNRLTQKVTPQVTYSQGTNTGPGWTFPWGPYANSTGGYTIAPDTATFTYDPVGHILTAQNSNAQVHRTYYLDGSIKRDTLIVRSYAGANWGLHLYGLGYTYDLDGRRTKLAKPHQFTGGPASDTTYYTYDPLTGKLASLIDFYNKTFSYTYDLASRIKTLTYPGAITDNYTYDGDGRLITRLEGSASDTLHLDQYQYDWRDKEMRVTTRIDTTYFLYSALGNLVWSHNSTDSLKSRDVEYGLPDALGNHTVRNYQSSRIGAQSADIYGYAYQAKSGRMISAGGPTGQTSGGTGYSETSVFDNSGNRTNFISGDGHSFEDEQVAYYAADNQLRALDHRRCITPGAGQTCGGLGGTFEEYRYDALGRRVLVRSNRYALCGGPNCHSEIKAVIWDGSQDLFELRADGQGPNGPTDANMDAYDATPSNPNTEQFYGRAGYTIGATLDLPLAVEHPTGLVKQYFIPHPNWHGLFDQGTDATGAVIQCLPACIDWPAIPNALDYSLLARQEANLDSWSGDLVNQSRDISGQMYMRNRYYDPLTGRFTQEDPIGLSGGLNAYGFGSGDVVNYSDPFGLCPPCGEENEIPGLIQHAVSPHRAPTAEQEALQDPGLADPVAIGTGFLAGPVDAAIAKGVARAGADATATEGTKLYRVFGGDAKPTGRYWTPVNPAEVGSFRAAAGLPVENTGRFVIEGVLKDATGVKVGRAAAGAGGRGGIPEFLVPKPETQIQITRVSGANPPF